MSTAAAAIKAALLALTDEDGRKKLGWVLAAILSPVIVVVALVCVFSAASQHNISTVELCFHGGTIPDSAAPEYRQAVEEIRDSFESLDSMAEEINALVEDEESLDADRVKAIFYVLYFGGQQPDEAGLQSFVDCFVTYTEETRTVTITDEEGNEAEVEETYPIPHLVDDLAQVYEGSQRITRSTPTASTTWWSMGRQPGSEAAGFPARRYPTSARTASAPPSAWAGRVGSPRNSATGRTHSPAKPGATPAWTWRCPPARPSGRRCRGRSPLRPMTRAATATTL